MRGWHAPALNTILAKGWSKLQQAIACAWDEASTVSALAELRAAASQTISERSMPYKVRPGAPLPSHGLEPIV